MKDCSAWRIDVDRGTGKVDTTVHEGGDIDFACLRIGQMVLSTGIDQIVVYRDGTLRRHYVTRERENMSEQNEQFEQLEDEQLETFMEVCIERFDSTQEGNVDEAHYINAYANCTSALAQRYAAKSQARIAAALEKIAAGAQVSILEGNDIARAITNLKQ